MNLVPLSELMPSRIPTLDPSKSSDETFELWSIPSFDQGKPEVLKGSEIGSSKKCVDPDDVLLSRIVPHIRRSWIVQTNIQGYRQIASSEWITFRSKRFYPPYLRQVLVSDPFHAEFMRTVSGVGGSLLRARPEGVKAIEIPLPPLDEQKRIATILDQADGLRRLRQRAIDRLTELGQAIFYEMFGDPVSNPMEWDDQRTLGESSEIVSGITVGRKLNGKQTREVPYLAVINVHDRELKLDHIKTIDATEDEISRYNLRKDDLLLTEGGDPDKLGRGTLWNDELPECIHQNHIFRVRLSCHDVDPLFLNWLVGSERGKRYFLRSAKQTTGIASINITQLRGFPLLIPPMDLQLRFSERVKSVGVHLTDQISAFDKTSSLLSSLQQRAFRGEL